MATFKTFKYTLLTAAALATLILAMSLPQAKAHAATTYSDNDIAYVATKISQISDLVSQINKKLDNTQLTKIEKFQTASAYSALSRATLIDMVKTLREKVNPSSSSDSNTETNSATTNPTQTAKNPTCTLVISPDSVVEGGSAKAVWSTTNATNVLITSTDGDYNPDFPKKGEWGFMPLTTTTFTLTVYGTNGNTARCSDTIQVNKKSTTNSNSKVATVDIVGFFVKDGSFNVLSDIKNVVEGQEICYYMVNKDTRKSYTLNGAKDGSNNCIVAKADSALREQNTAVLTPKELPEGEYKVQVILKENNKNISSLVNDEWATIIDPKTDSNIEITKFINTNSNALVFQQGSKLQVNTKVINAVINQETCYYLVNKDTGAYYALNSTSNTSPDNKKHCQLIPKTVSVSEQVFTGQVPNDMPKGYYKLKVTLKDHGDNVIGDVNDKWLPNYEVVVEPPTPTTKNTSVDISEVPTQAKISGDLKVVSNITNSKSGQYSCYNLIDKNGKSSSLLNTYLFGSHCDASSQATAWHPTQTQWTSYYYGKVPNDIKAGEYTLKISLRGDGGKELSVDTAKVKITK